jgi:hypothetical protein
MKKNQIISFTLLFFVASYFIISCKKDNTTTGSANCSFTYSAWTTCSGGTETRTYTTSPAGCTGTPPNDSTTRTCTITCPTITFTTAVVNVLPCPSTNGNITVNASGGVAPYTYSKNGGTAQSSNVISNLTAGSYVIVVKDANGCSSASQSITVGTSAAGPLFSAVRTIIRANCGNTCHLNGNSSGAVNFDSDCSIVSKSARIFTRCVTLSTMPQNAPLNQTLKDQITAWVNAGGRYTD